ncbi:hypothetical protein [Psychrobacter sp. I-STPA6b]|uniref:hypothetical protein n=1 Tax=Psychrobacter sp. I-STPA6b TaxID=2585718 RepID=UPI001D0C1D01|nr:hypothetical protein [Psychrobacter sp. I-STPA6b]
MEKLINIMKSDIEELHLNRKISRAKELSEQTGMHINHNEYPSYFFGDPQAKFVLVHLNPKQQDNLSDGYEGDFKFADFDEYFKFHRYYGKIHYGEHSNKTLKSPFDLKQIRFIKPFNVIEFNDTDGKYSNLEKVIDNKLQLELLPFGSSKFETALIKGDALEPYIETLLDTITSQKREYVIFCGKVFESLLKKYIISKKDYEFKLPKVDGSAAKNNSRFSKIIINFNDKEISAGIAKSFAQQGLNMSAYGEKCCHLYNQ